MEEDIVYLDDFLQDLTDAGVDVSQLNSVSTEDLEEDVLTDKKVKGGA